MNRMWDVDPLESVGENFVINVPGSQFQTQQASISSYYFLISQVYWVTY
jgi:hypothetical protein